MLNDEDEDFEINSSLRCADIHTEEELLKVYLKKLKTLKSLYLEQYSDFERDLRSSRSRYLLSDNQIGIKESLPSNNEKDDDRKCLNLSSKIDCLISQNIISKDNQQSCQTQSELCHGKCLPLTNFCLKHIMDDNHQLLYKKCSSKEDCNRMALNLSQEPRCFLHPKIDLSVLDFLEKYIND